MSKQKGLAPLVIIILIALGFGGYLLYQKQFKSAVAPLSAPNVVISPAPNASDETANWKAFNSELEGVDYSIDYPEDYKTYKNPELNKSVDLLSNMRSILGNFKNGDILITIGASKSNQTKKFESKDVGRVSSMKNSTGTPVIYFDLECDYYPLSDNNLKNKCDQILSTFKFTQ